MTDGTTVRATTTGVNAGVRPSLGDTDAGDECRPLGKSSIGDIIFDAKIALWLRRDVLF